MSLLNLINTVADVATAANTANTATNTARTARDVEQQSQLIFDAMTPEEKARVIAAQKVRAELALKAQKQAYRAKVIVAFVIFIIVAAVMKSLGG